jgi:hypothetical protein
MKATHAGPSIGKALGFFGGDRGTVLVLVNLSYYSPNDASLVAAQTNDLQGQLAGLGVQINHGTLAAQDVVVAGSITAKDLTVTGTTTVAQLVIGGHIITAGDAPTIAAGAAACENPQIAVTGNDTSGMITITTGLACKAAGVLANVAFTKPYEAAPRVLLTPVGDAAAGLEYNVGSTGLTGFTLSTNTIPASGASYIYFYHAEQ